MKQIILLYSGGMDSTYLLFQALNNGINVHCLIFDYGQQHKIEVEKAQRILGQIITTCKLTFEVVPITIPVKSNLMEDTKTYEGVSPFHVPSRNAIFVSIAAGVAESLDISTIWIGSNYADRENKFPDCYQEWVYQMNKLLAINGSMPITLEAPLLGMPKYLIEKDASRIIPNNILTKIHSGYDTE